jgi:hypothetical protein
MRADGRWGRIWSPPFVTTPDQQHLKWSELGAVLRTERVAAGGI